MNAAQDLQVPSVSTVVRAIHSDLIAPKLVGVRIWPSVINLTEIVHVQKDGLVSIVVKGYALTICTVLTVTILANVMPITQICVIRGPVNAIVKLDGVAAFVTDLVLS